MMDDGQERVEAIQEWAKRKSWFDTEIVDSIGECLDNGKELSHSQDVALDNIISGFKIPYDYPVDLWNHFKTAVVEEKPLFKMWLNAVESHRFNNDGLTIVFSERFKCWAESVRRHEEFLELVLERMNWNKRLTILPPPPTEEERNAEREYEDNISAIHLELETVLVALKKWYRPDEMNLGIARWVDRNKFDLNLDVLVNWQEEPLLYYDPATDTYHNW